MLPLTQYEKEISLREPFKAHTDVVFNEEACLKTILGFFRPEALMGSPALAHQRQLVSALITTWHPDKKLPSYVIDAFDSLLQFELTSKKIVDSAALKSVDEEIDTAYRHGKQCSLWRGDITTLKVDAIVNAANSQMLGCFIPGHKCIDNAIHNAGGPQIRQDCFAIMDIQGRLEQTGGAKITRGYNLPAKFILHTVGPIVPDRKPTSTHGTLLASCYQACLDLAAETQVIKSVAFCSISTGVFGYPIADAAYVALSSVDEWLSMNPGIIDRVVFNVFSDHDHAIYHKFLKHWND